MKYLNLGCGSHYSDKREWINLDFISSGPGVIAHNLLSGIPFPDNSFDLVYHSHVLEHFSKDDGSKFISECLRVLKPGGIIRIAIPDLERIAKEYLHYLEEGVNNPDNSITEANYEWMLLEMYDQTVRNISGGNMGKYLFQESIPNEDFVFQRIGEEGRGLRRLYLESKSARQSGRNVKPGVYREGFLAMVKRRLKDFLLRKLHVDAKIYQIGNFRLGGEIHQWMYDRYSLSNLLKLEKAKEIQIRDAFTSYIRDWDSFKLDGKDGVVRKPDSLFIEAIKK